MAEADGTALRTGRPDARDRSAFTALCLTLMCGRFARFSSVPSGSSNNSKNSGDQWPKGLHVAYRSEPVRRHSPRKRLASNSV